jgi:nicotinamide riboside kinase
MTATRPEAPRAAAPRAEASGAAAGAPRLATASGPVLAVLGAESTGKTTLVHALALALRARGREAVAVGEYLREFCDAQGRTPRADEQAAIAAEQWRRIEAAARGGAIVVADTTPLMIAVYSDYIFGDRTLYEAALERQRACAATLLTGLDLPWRPDGLQRDGPQVRQPVDTLLRAALERAALPHAVVYGEGEARTAAALAAAAGALGLDLRAETPEPDAARPLRLAGRCRECLVPDCEHLRGTVPRGTGKSAA